MVPGMNVNGCVIELMYIPYAREALLRLGGPWSSRFTKTNCCIFIPISPTIYHITTKHIPRAL